jgi:hypothetical protein
MTNFKKFIYLTFSILMAQFAFSQASTIEGTGAHWMGKEVSLSICIDYISNTFEIVDQTKIDKKGRFTLKFETSETTTAWIVVNRWKAPIIIEPGKTYQISIVETKESVLVDTWQNGFFDYDFIDLSPDDLNAKLSKFDGEYFNFYLDNAQYIGTFRMNQLVKKFAEQREDSTWMNFESDYKNYSIAEMKLSSGFKRNDLFQTYLSDTSRYYSSEAWYRFFELFFTDYFQNFDSNQGGMAIYNRFRKGMNADSLDILLQKDDFLENEYTRQLVTLNAVAQVGGSNQYDINTLYDITAWVSENAINSQIRLTSEMLKTKLSNQPSQISFEKLTENWSPKVSRDESEKYILVMVSDSQNKESQKEALVLESLIGKYGDIFEVLELNVNSKLQIKSEEWSSFDVKSIGTFLDTYKIYGIPHFMWFNPQGEMVEYNLEKPSMGLEKRLYKIQSDKKESQRIKIGSK